MPGRLVLDKVRLSAEVQRKVGLNGRELKLHPVQWSLERTQALYWFHLSYSPQWQMLNLKALETIVQFSYLTFFHFLLRHTK